MQAGEAGRFADEPRARPTRGVRGAAEQQLADLLRDQLADGQTEMLLALEHTAASVRARTRELTAAAELPGQRLGLAQEALTVSLEQAVDRIEGRVDSLQDRLMDVLGQLGEATERLEQLVERVEQASATADQRMEQGTAAAAKAVRAAGRRAAAEVAAVGEDLVQVLEAERQSWSSVAPARPRAPRKTSKESP